MSTPLTQLAVLIDYFPNELAKEIRKSSYIDPAVFQLTITAFAGFSSVLAPASTAEMPRGADTFLLLQEDGTLTYNDEYGKLCNIDKRVVQIGRPNVQHLSESSEITYRTVDCMVWRFNIVRGTRECLTLRSRRRVRERSDAKSIVGSYGDYFILYNDGTVCYNDKPLSCVKDIIQITCWGNSIFVLDILGQVWRHEEEGISEPEDTKLLGSDMVKILDSGLLVGLDGAVYLCSNHKLTRQKYDNVKQNDRNYFLLETGQIRSVQNEAHDLFNSQTDVLYFESIGTYCSDLILIHKDGRISKYDTDNQSKYDTDNQSKYLDIHSNSHHNLSEYLDD